MTAPVKAVAVQSLSDASASPGAYKFGSRPDGRLWLNYICPCGCGRLGGVQISVDGQRPRVWAWDGNRDVPTLSPSIQHMDDCRWHGWLRNGEWITC